MEALLEALPVVPEPVVPEDVSTPRLLYVLPLDSGGTPQTNEDLMAGLSRQYEVECLLLRCRGRLMQLLLFYRGAYLPLASHRLAVPVTPLPHANAEYDRVCAQWVKRYGVRLVHVRHLAWNSLGVFAAARSLGVPAVFSLHDYYPLCPSVKLLNEQGEPCGGHCAAGQCGNELWPGWEVPPLAEGKANLWQAQFAEALGECDALVTTTAQARDILLGRMRRLKRKPWRIIPHGRDLTMNSLAVPPASGEPLRVVLPGHLTFAKGGELLRQLGEQAAPQALELHVLGSVSDNIALPDNVIVHGAYRRGELAERLAEIRPHVGAVLSIWAETWCHTLTELWAAGLPVIGLDIGAVGERLKQSGGGWRVSEFTPEALATALQQARCKESWAARHAAVLRWQQTTGAEQNTAAMAKAYADLYRSLGVALLDRALSS